MVNEIGTVASLLDTGVLLVIAAAFLVMVWRLLGNLQRKEGQVFEIAQGFSAALEKSSAVIEANTRVIEGNQQVLEQVLKYNGELAREQRELTEEFAKVLELNNKMYTELRILRERLPDG